jgi:hypothetical protein
MLTRVLVALLLTFVIACAPAHAQNTLFFEGFDGAYLNTWNGTPGVLPAQSLIPFREQTVTHVGDTGKTFSTLGDAGVVVLNAVNAPSWSRYGAVASAVFPMTYGVVEARINTLEQGGSNIDGLFDLWLLNASDHTRYVHVGLFGDQYDTLRSWIYVSNGSLIPLSAPDTLPEFSYKNNTWYRVRITQLPGLPLRVSVWSDDLSTELVSFDFDLDLADVGSEFRIGVSQWMGGPHLTHSLLSAVDYVSVKAAYNESDLNGDGFPDLLLQNQVDRRIAVLTMKGTSISSSGSLTPTLPANWRAAGVADFDRDGRNEVVVQNTETRAVSILFLTGQRITASIPVNPIMPANWQVLAAADVDGDNRPDLVVENTSTFQIAALLMNGTKMKGSRSFSKSLPAGWMIAGAADFDGDGQTDLVVQNSATRQVSILTLIGQAIVGSASVPPTLPADWYVAAVGDYNADGKPDLAVQNTVTRRISILTISGGKITSSLPVSPTVMEGWRLLGPR